MNAHPFTHLGPAPYRFAGRSTPECRALTLKLRQDSGEVCQAIDAEGATCGGSCDHCGMGIKNFCWFEAADGTRFKVGSTCAEKAFETDEDRASRMALKKMREAIREADAAKRAAKKEARRKASAAKIAAQLSELESWADSVGAKLREVSSPSGYGTCADYLNWIWENVTSDKGRVTALLKVQAAFNV